MDNQRCDNIINVDMILQYIKMNRLTKKEFCKQCQISTSTFYKITRNENFHLIALFKIAKNMDVKVSQLIK